MGRSFEAAFDAEFASLHRYLARRVGAAADELAADTFAVAFRNWERLDPERPVRPWLYGIAANLMRHHWRKERRMLRAYARSGVDPVFADEDAAVERADADARHRELATALATLQPDEREILLLRAWAELTDSEIADSMSPTRCRTSAYAAETRRCRTRNRTISGRKPAQTRSASGQE